MRERVALCGGELRLDIATRAKGSTLIAACHAIHGALA